MTTQGSCVLMMISTQLINLGQTERAKALEERPLLVLLLRNSFPYNA